MTASETGWARRRVLSAAAAVTAVPLFSGLRATPAVAAASLLGPSMPRHYRFRLGEFEVTNILDAAAVIDGPWPIVGEGQPKEDVERLMGDHLLPAGRFQPGFTPTIVNTGREVVLFDTGNGADGFVPRPHGGWLAAMLAPAGFAPEQVDVVVLTHAHPDHIGGLMETGRPLFPNARYVIGDVEHEFWSKDDPLSSPKDSNTYRSAMLFRTNLAPLAERTSVVRNGGEVVPGIRAVAAFGHTPGHLAYHIESGTQRMLVWGDCAHHEVASLAHPEWHAFFDMDKEMGARTRSHIYDMVSTDRLLVSAYHMTFPSLGYVERKDGAYRWVPVTYQLAL